MKHPKQNGKDYKMTKETKATTTEKEDKRPDFTVRQYRHIRTVDAVKLRKETVGAAWKNENGSITLRLNGVQTIENDLYIFPVDIKEAE